AHLLLLEQLAHAAHHVVAGGASFLIDYQYTVHEGLQSMCGGWAVPVGSGSALFATAAGAARGATGATIALLTAFRSPCLRQLLGALGALGARRVHRGQLRGMTLRGL